jgi:hypothetical protein
MLVQNEQYKVLIYRKIYNNQQLVDNVEMLIIFLPLCIKLRLIIYFFKIINHTIFCLEFEKFFYTVRFDSHI